MVLEREKELLHKTHDIIVAYQNEKSNQMLCGENTGNQFNIFEIIGISTREVYMCKVLAELLSPKGCHRQGTKYLELFCERFLPENIKREINLDKVSIITEDLTKNLDEDEYKLLDLIFDMNLKKLFLNNSIEVNQLNSVQWHYLQCEFLLMICRKIKLLSGSLEEFLSHDAFVNANFHYDEPHQAVYDEIQNCLNTMAAKDALDQVIAK